jgi:hypothetical protein
MLQIFKGLICKMMLLWSGYNTVIRSSPFGQSAFPTLLLLVKKVTYAVV